MPRQPEQLDQVTRAIAAHLARRHGVITTAEARHLGLSDEQIEYRLRTGEWVTAHRGVYVLGGPAHGHETRLFAAVQAAGGVAFRRSASWLWGLHPVPPGRPQVAVDLPVRARVTGVEVHSRRPTGRRARTVRGIPVTDPVLTIVDLAASGLPAAALDDLVDVALARRLTTAAALAASVASLACQGRRGPAALRSVLGRRGLVEPPRPSVLESKVLRLLRALGITPLSVEVAWDGGRYRIDVLLTPTVALEADGFAFHSSPRARSRDLERRNRLRAGGLHIIETDWLTVVHQPERLQREIEAVLPPDRAAQAAPNRTDRRRDRRRESAGGLTHAPPPSDCGARPASPMPERIAPPDPR